MKSLGLVLGAVLLLVGCAPKGPTVAVAAPPPVAAAPADPMEASRESISQGNYQLAACATDLSNLIDSVKNLQRSTKSPDVKAAMASILEQLDDAGGSIADYTEEPPALDKFKFSSPPSTKRDSKQSMEPTMPCTICTMRVTRSMTPGLTLPPMTPTPSMTSETPWTTSLKG